jgi:predicted RND superfamily exporter protein
MVADRTGIDRGTIEEFVIDTPKVGLLICSVIFIISFCFLFTLLVFPSLFSSYLSLELVVYSIAYAAFGSLGFKVWGA